MNLILRFLLLLLAINGISAVLADDAVNPLRSGAVSGNKLRPVPPPIRFPQGSGTGYQQPVARPRTNHLQWPQGPGIASASDDATANAPAYFINRDSRRSQVVQTSGGETAPSRPANKLRPADDQIELHPLPSSRRAAPLRRGRDVGADINRVRPAEPAVTTTPEEFEADALADVGEPEAEVKTAPPEVSFPAPVEIQDSPAVVEGALVPKEAIKFEPYILDPASLKGVQPGQADLEAVVAAWGKASKEEESAGVVHRTFGVSPFRSVQASFERDRLISAEAVPAKEMTVEAAAKEFELDLASAASVHVSPGEAARMFFPERGVTLHFATGKPEAVARIRFELCRTEHFLARAEQRLAFDYESALRDLATAIQLDPNSVDAHGLQATALFEIGHREEALAACRKAIGMNADDPQLFLTQAVILAELCDFEPALASTKQALDRCENLPEVRARGLNQLADHLALGPARDYKTALGFRVQAIDVARQVSKSKDRNVRSVALEAIVDAHLGAAQDVAWGAWKDKQTAATQWLTRGIRAATDALASGDLPPGQRLKVSQKVLAVYAGLEGHVDPAPQAEQTVRTARQLIEATKDPLRKHRYAWEAGVALYDAVQTLQSRGETDEALKYGQMAVDYFDEAIAGRELVGRERFVLGRLYYRVGSLHSLGRRNHDAAAHWFAKAAPLLLSDYPNMSGAEMASRGESLVSIGVSFWAIDRREEAVGLTTHGARLIEEAVEAKALDRVALKVPYGNLAKMHRKLGNANDADSFESLARKKATTLR